MNLSVIPYLIVSAMLSTVACGTASQPGALEPPPQASTSHTQQSPSQPPKRVRPQPSQNRPGSPPMRAIWKQHNRHRADHCAKPLQWSSKLAKVAQGWADTLQQSGCAFEHSPQGNYGENLSFYAPVGTMTPEEIATGWYDEVGLYNFQQGGFSMQTGHFTQLVWRGTTAVGCGVSRCNGGEIWVCNYEPAGNMRGAFGDNVKAASCR